MGAVGTAGSGSATGGGADGGGGATVSGATGVEYQSTNFRLCYHDIRLIISFDPK